MKEILFKDIESRKSDLINMADDIFDHPELCFEETYCSNLLEDYLEKEGFIVERGLGTLDTAFRATYVNKENGPNIGLLCEYDALTMGHACGHHMQGPAILAAAIAIKNNIKDYPYNLIVYGTPAEEGGGGKIKMIDEGFIKELDIALMMHGGPATQTDVKSLAMSSRVVTFHGKSSHAALKPEDGRSALDALLLTFQGVEFLREHVKEDSRMQYTILDAGGPSNVVPAKAVGSFSLRSYSSIYLNEIVERFDNIVKGAALMTGTEYEIVEKKRLESKIPVPTLNDVLMKNAELVDAPNRKPAREKTGSSDFGNVTNIIPGSCIRLAFVPDGTSSHSQEFLDNGKEEEGHNAVILSAKILAASVYDILSEENLLDTIKTEFKNNIK